MAHLRSVHVGTPRDEAWAGRLQRTAIDKVSVTGPVRVTARGVAGDEVADTVHHGHPHQAVYAVAREDLDRWQEELGGPVPDGLFGENLTTSGIDVNDALVGERWRIGGVLLEVASVRIPCSVFASWLGRNGLPERGWVRRFTQDARPGPYLRVLQEGELQAGDAVEVVHRPDHDVTVSTLFRALTGEPALLPRLLAVEGLVAAHRERAEAHVAGSSYAVER